MLSLQFLHQLNALFPSEIVNLTSATLTFGTVREIDKSGGSADAETS